MRKVTIGDLGDIYTGNTPSKKNVEFYDSEDIMFIKPDILDFDINTINESNEYVSERAREKARIIPKDSLLVSCIGNIGKLGINKKEAAFNQQINAIVHNEKIVSSRYLAYLIKYNQKKLEAIANAPVVPIINKTQFSNFELFIHENLETQNKIVEVLDKAQSLIDKKKEQIELLDELVKSRFVEMFGDPMINPYNWETIELKEIMKEKAMNGFFAKNTEYKEDGNSQVMWLGDVINRRYSNTKGLKRVDVTEKELEKYRVKYGDLLFCRSSLTKEGIGKASAVPRNIENNIMFECHIIKVNLDLEKCIPEFMQIQSSMDYFRNQIMSKSKTATMTTIGQEGIVTNKVILPPLEKQKIFVEFVRKIDEIKSKMETSLSELEDNFNSLMQRLFKGELF